MGPCNMHLLSLVDTFLGWSALFRLLFLARPFFYSHKIYTSYMDWLVSSCVFLFNKVSNPTPWNFVWVNFGWLESQYELIAYTVLVVLIFHTHLLFSSYGLGFYFCWAYTLVESLFLVYLYSFQKKYWGIHP